MARDGTPVGSSRSAGAAGPAFTLLVAFFAVVAISRRRHPAQTPVSEAPIEALPPAMLQSEGSGGAKTPRVPRFFKGALTGIVTGIALGAIAAVLITVSAADARAGVIVGTGLAAPPPTYDGIIAARIVAQDMNPLLLYADDDVAAQYAPAPPDPPAPRLTPSPVDHNLEDNAGIIFAVLTSLTVASWGLIMRGLTSRPAVANAGVE